MAKIILPAFLLVTGITGCNKPDSHFQKHSVVYEAVGTDPKSIVHYQLPGDQKTIDTVLTPGTNRFLLQFEIEQDPTSLPKQTLALSCETRRGQNTDTVSATLLIDGVVMQSESDSVAVLITYPN